MIQDLAMALLFAIGYAGIIFEESLAFYESVCGIRGGVVIIAANAGGAWTPIGDVTTMLWIHGQVSTLQTMKDLFVPSAISLAVPLALMSLTLYSPAE
ncbi:hypothetical protein Leryth_006089 [Lithospermum erythrorhizon]|nr:hypothetical protein Leryth_006089 [Lithospermum erythrorhizon]